MSKHSGWLLHGFCVDAVNHVDKIEAVIRQSHEQGVQQQQLDRERDDVGGADHAFRTHILEVVPQKHQRNEHQKPFQQHVKDRRIRQKIHVRLDASALQIVREPRDARKEHAVVEHAHRAGQANRSHQVQSGVDDDRARLPFPVPRIFGCDDRGARQGANHREHDPHREDLPVIRHEPVHAAKHKTNQQKEIAKIVDERVPALFFPNPEFLKRKDGCRFSQVFDRHQRQKHRDPDNHHPGQPIHSSTSISLYGAARSTQSKTAHRTPRPLPEADTPRFPRSKTGSPRK